MAIICGIDEAGRGPVIGPLVISGVCIDEKDEANLKAIGAKDSKLLAPNRRSSLFKKITKISKKYEIIQLSPKEVDKAVESDKTNLNWLEADVSVRILNKLNPDIAYIDCPSNNIGDYTKYIKNKLKNKKIKIVAEHKADVRYVVVGAASILAKVTRDEEIEKIKKQIKQDIGSGYPSDPVTVEFLKKNHDKYPSIFRKSWSSYRKVVEEKKQRKIGGF